LAQNGPRPGVEGRGDQHGSKRLPVVNLPPLLRVDVALGRPKANKYGRTDGIDV